MSKTGLPIHRFWAKIQVMNWNIAGHEWAADLLAGQIARGEQRHAYLITGARGTGRRTLALRFAQALNCPQPTAPGQPCLQCRTCRQTAAMQLPDLSVIAAEGEGGTIKVEQIRELGRTLSLTPYASSTRFALLLNFDSATISAQNALLKTLEEAPPQVVLVLTALTTDTLLPTIVSRCEVLRLRPLPADTLADLLVSRWGIEPAEARLLAHLSSGRVGEALRLHEDPQLLEERQGWLEDLLTLLGANRRERFAYAAGITARTKRDRLKAQYQTWLLFWRDVFMCASRAAVPLINLDWQEAVTSLARQLDPAVTRQVLAGMEQALNTLETTNTQPAAADRGTAVGLALPARNRRLACQLTEHKNNPSAGHSVS